MSERFYLPDLTSDTEHTPNTGAVLTGPEAVHLGRVMRAKVGDIVYLFNGDGWEYRARIETIAHSKIDLTILDRRFDDREPDLDLTMAVALPKGDRQKWLIEKLTELGVRRYIPLSVDREDIKVDEKVLERLRRQVIEASKQCGRCRLMEITPAMTRRQILSAFPVAELNILCHPISDGWFGQVSFADLVKGFTALPQSALVLIGPVGGFTDTEVRQAVDDHWPILDLGRQVYRVETAAICAASLFLHL